SSLNSSTTSGLLIDGGWGTESACSSARVFTGGGVSFRPRPTGRSGCVYTATVSCSLWMSLRSVGNAKCGEPMKTTRIVTRIHVFSASAYTSANSALMEWSEDLEVRDPGPGHRRCRCGVRMWRQAQCRPHEDCGVGTPD